MSRKLAIYILIIGSTFIIAQNFLNSNYVKRKVEQKLISGLEKQGLKNIDLGKLRLNLFPLRVTMDSVSLSRMKDEDDLVLYLKKPSIELHLIQSLLSERKLIMSASVESGRVDYFNLENTKSKKKTSEEIKKDIKILFEKIKSNQVKLERISIEQIIANLNQYSFEISDLILENEFDLYKVNLNFLGLKNVPIDSFQLNTQISEEKIIIEQLDLSLPVSELHMRGLIDNYLEKEVMELSFNGLVDMKEIVASKIISDHKLKGIVSINGKLKGVLDSLTAQVKLKTKKFESKYFSPDEMSLDAELKNKQIIIENAYLKKDKGTAVNNSKQIIYDIKKNSIFPNNLTLNLEKMSLKEALQSVPNVAQKIDGEIVGGFSLGLENKEIKIDILEGSEIKSLRLSNEEREIINVKKVKFKKGVFEFISAEDLLKIDVQTYEKDPISIKVSGNIKKGKVNISSREKMNIAFSEINHIADFEITGSANTDLKVTGDIENTIISFNGSYQQVRFANFFLGDTTGKVSLSTGQSYIELGNIFGDTGSGYKANGRYYLEKGKSNVTLNFNKMSLDEFKDFHGPVFQNVEDFYFELCEGDFSGDYKVNGYGDLSTLRLNGFTFSENLECLGERFDRVFSRYTLREGTFKTRSFRAQKGKARFLGSMQYSLDQEVLTFNFNSKDFKLADIDSYADLKSSFQSDIIFKLKGSSAGEELNFNLNASLINSYLSGLAKENSLLNMVKDNDAYYIDFKLFENVLLFKSDLDFKSKTKKSRFALETNVNTWQDLFGLISSYPQDYRPLKGKFSSDHLLEFNFTNLSSLAYTASIDSFLFDHPEIDFKLKNPTELRIKDGSVEKFNINLKSNAGDFFKTIGSGNISSLANFKSNGKLSAFKISKILNTNINLGGNLNFNGMTKINNENFDYDYYLKSTDLKLNNLPMDLSFSNIWLDLGLKKKLIELKKLIVPMGDGKFISKGNIDFKKVIPKVFMEYELDNSKVKINDRSYLYFSGRGNFIGKKRPYVLNGDLKVLKGEIKDEFESFTDDQELEKNFIQSSFMPNSGKKGSKSFVRLNMNVRTQKPVKIRNSLLEASFGGNGSFFGDLEKLRGVGRLSIDQIDRKKLSFNNNDIDISKLNINFIASEEIFNPYVDFSGRSNVSDYDLTINAVGLLDKLRFDFTSEPFLNKTDILSLLAFGYAEDPSDRIGEDQRENLSSVGFSNLIFNQLKINSTLKKNFGLTLNVNTEYAEDDASLLEGRSQTGGRSNSIRTTTKVEVKKDISDKVNLSVSSSILDDSEQRQKMSVDYEIKKNVHLNGVYEIINNETGVNENDNNSVGADLKLQWTFE